MAKRQRGDSASHIELVNSERAKDEHEIFDDYLEMAVSSVAPHYRSLRAVHTIRPVISPVWLCLSQCTITRLALKMHCVFTLRSRLVRQGSFLLWQSFGLLSLTPDHGTQSWALVPWRVPTDSLRWLRSSTVLRLRHALCIGFSLGRSTHNGLHGDRARF